MDVVIDQSKANSRDPIGLDFFSGKSNLLAPLKNEEVSHRVLFLFCYFFFFGACQSRLASTRDFTFDSPLKKKQHKAWPEGTSSHSILGSTTLPSFTGFYWVLRGFTGFYWVLLGLLGFTGFYWVYWFFTGVYRVLLGFTEFYWVLLGFQRFYCVVLGFTGIYWVLHGFKGLYWVLLGFTAFYWVSLSFIEFF